MRPWDAWIAFLAIIGVSVNLALDDSGPLWARIVFPLVMILLGLEFALAETADARDRARKNPPDSVDTSHPRP